MLTNSSGTGAIKNAAEQVVNGVGEALKEMHLSIDNNPNNLIPAKLRYEHKVKQLAKGWEKSWKLWANTDLGEAYIAGIKDADTITSNLAQYKQINPAVQPMSSETLLVDKVSPLTFFPGLPRATKSLFKPYPGHFTFYDTYRKAMYEGFKGTATQIVRTAEDIYKQTAALAGDRFFKESSTYTRRKMSQKMLNDFARKGLQSVTYKNGARVSIDSYSEMATRTMASHANVEASLKRYEQRGYDLVRVSSHFRACELCTPYQGKIFSRSGKNKKFRPLSTAISGGLFHPNCVHRLSPYFPGVSASKLETSASPSEHALIEEHGWNKANKIAYKAQQKQRGIERQVRNWKRREIASMDVTDAGKAHVKVNNYRNLMRKHLKDNPYLPRKYYREGVKGWQSIVGLTRKQVSGPGQYYAGQIITKAKKQVDVITDIITGTADKVGIRNFGLEFRLKTKDSLSRKITNLFRDSRGYSPYSVEAAGISDAVRYTYIMDDTATYAAQVQRVADNLISKGMTPVKWKNYWGGKYYKGINSNFRYNGQVLEIQFHTPKSFILKQGVNTTGGANLVKEQTSHFWYEKARTAASKAEADTYYAKMIDIWKNVETPAGVGNISIVIP